MSKRVAIFLAAVTCVVILSLQCRKAEGVPADPMDQQAIDALVGYIRIDTSNPPGNETEGAKFLQQLLAKEGIAAQLVGADPKRQSLYARLRSGNRERALLLLHHIDVVPPVVAEWTKPPFSGMQSNGYIWGRGALDIKSLGIAELMAMIELKRRNVPLTRDIVYLAVADEELGGLHGCKELLEKNPELFENVGFVLNEGGYNETIVDKVTFWGIETQQKVPLFLRVHAKGAAGHSAGPPEDGGTVAKLVRGLDGVLKIETPYRLTPEVARFFHEAGKARSDPRSELLRTIAEPLDIKRIEKVLTPGYRSLLRDTVALTHISGGIAVNAIPANAMGDVDIRLLPGSTTEAMIGRVKEAVGKNAEVEVLLAGEPVPESPADTELFRTLARAFTSAEPGSLAAPIVGGGTSDSRFFRARGVVAYGIAPFKVNYYDADTVHANDERIRARFFVEGVRLTRRIVSDFCTQKPR
ncbi:MAG TPA: M20/M25/M40 family metallo-hydrolase [Thermoanaerobaculia bacterium]|jgi:acetylornithine deacetylase/succinyl-diaminopimelate desuccinylase-like protein